MPYKGKINLPDAVKELPEEAQTIWQGAFNAVYSKFKELPSDKRESRAFEIAWAVVAGEFRKDADGKWIALSEDDIRDALIAETDGLQDETEDEEDGDEMTDLREWNAAARKKLAAGQIKGGFAGPGNTFPIADSSDVADAWGLAGKAADPDAVRRKIIAIAKKHGWLAAMPETAQAWAKENGVELAEEDYPDGQLCPYCEADLALPKPGWYACGNCGKALYVEEADSDYEDYHAYRADRAPKSAPAQPSGDLRTAKVLKRPTADEDEMQEADFVAADSNHIVTLGALMSDYAATEDDGQKISHVEVARVGEYTDAHGANIAISEADIDRMVANFTANRAGQDIPIDVMHEKREAGGWLRRVWRHGKLLMAEVAWNGLGAKLVTDKVYRYLSASIAMPDWVLRSVSLVNFPAIKGLKPVELSEWLLSQPYPTVSQAVSKTGDKRGSPRATHSGLKTPPARQPAQSAGAQKQHGGKNMADESALHEQETPQPAEDQSIAEFKEALQRAKDEAVAKLSEQIVTELAEKREQMLAQLREEMADERELSEFTLSATASGRHALPVKPDELKAVLKELPKPQRQKVMELLTKVAQAGTVDLGESGTAAEKPDKRRLEPDMRAILRQQMRGGMTVETFFKANPDLGDMAGYDLAEFGIGK